MFTLRESHGSCGWCSGIKKVGFSGVWDVMSKTPWARTGRIGCQFLGAGGKRVDDKRGISIPSRRQISQMRQCDGQDGVDLGNVELVAAMSQGVRQTVEA